MLSTPFRPFLKSESKFSWVKSSPQSQCLHCLYLQRLLVSPFETLSFLSSFKWNQFLKLLLKLPFFTLVSPLSNYVAFKQILQVWNAPGVSVQLKWKSVGESWCGGNLTIKLLLVAFTFCRCLLPIYNLGFTAQGWKLIWANRNGSAHPITSVCFCSELCLSQFQKCLQKKSLTIFLFPPHPVCQKVLGMWSVTSLQCWDLLFEPGFARSWARAVLCIIHRIFLYEKI